MFSDCKNLESLDLSNWVFGNVLNIGSICSGCSSLKDFKISKILNYIIITDSFKNCKSLKKLDLSNIKIYTGSTSSSIDDFLLGTDLERFITPEFKLEPYTYNFLKFGDYPMYDRYGEKYWKLIGGPSVELFRDPPQYTYESDLYDFQESGRWLGMRYKKYSKDGKIICILNENQTEVRSDLIQPSFMENVETLILDASFIDCRNLFNGFECKKIDMERDATPKNNGTSAMKMFANMENLEEIKIPLTFGTFRISSNENMFLNCRKLKEIDLSEYYLNNCSNIRGMFENCYELKKITLNRNFKPQFCRDVRNLFKNCYKLEGINLQHFYLERADYGIDSMLENCRSIKFLDLSNVYFGSNSINNLLKGMNSLEELIVSRHRDRNLILPKTMRSYSGVEYTEVGRRIQITLYADKKYIINGIEYTSVEKGKWLGMDYDLFSVENEKDYMLLTGTQTQKNTSPNSFRIQFPTVKHIIIDAELTDLERLFEKNSAKSVKFTNDNFRIKNTVTSCHEMFKNTGISNIEFGNNFDTSNITNMSYMFNGCYNLLSLDLSNFDTRNVTNMDCMFYGDSYNPSGIEELNISNFKIGSSCNVDNMVYYCRHLKYIITPRIIKKQIILPEYFIRQSNNKVLDKMPANDILKKRIYVKRVNNIKTNNRDTIVVFNGDCYSKMIV